MNPMPQRLVVIEADPSGLTRGASFGPAARDAVAKALAGTAAVIFLVDGPKLEQIDADFPQGKLAAAGKPTLTPIKKATCDRPFTVSTPSAPVPPPPVMPQRPAPYAALKPGSIVLASESKEDGWWRRRS